MRCRWIFLCPNCIPWLFPGSEEKPCSRGRCPRQLYLPAMMPTAATMIGVPAREICRFGQVFLRVVSCNRNRSMPMARFRFHDDSCGANERPLPTRDQNIFSNRGALLPAADHKNTFPPKAPRLWHRCVPSACRISTRHPQLTRGQGFALANAPARPDFTRPFTR
jgi:hypothetical protein